MLVFLLGATMIENATLVTSSLTMSSEVYHSGVIFKYPVKKMIPSMYPESEATLIADNNVTPDKGCAACYLQLYDMGRQIA